MTWKIDPNAPTDVPFIIQGVHFMSRQQTLRCMAFKQAVNNSPDMLWKSLQQTMTTEDHTELKYRSGKIYDSFNPNTDQ